MTSDDTEHTFFVAQALLTSGDSADRFSRRLAWSLRLWLLGLPAGIGLATLRSILRLWMGFPPTRSGVRSAGNGPAMRVAPIGARFADDEAARRAFVSASTRLTHTDVRALAGARAVADTAAWIFREETVRPEVDAWIALLRASGKEQPEWLGVVDRMEDAARRDAPPTELAAALGQPRGVTGYVLTSVPVALHAWWLHAGDFRTTIEASLACGGDTDTVGAIAGALAGSTVGEAGIPADWIDGLFEWPRSVRVLREIADRLASDRHDAVPVFWPGLVPRNALFLGTVLTHGLRRLLPPY